MTLEEAAARLTVVLVGIFCAALLLAGCVRPVYLPRTPESMACARECMLNRNVCMAAQVGNDFAGFVCNNEQHDCLETCPGAS